MPDFRDKARFAGVHAVGHTKHAVHVFFSRHPRAGEGQGRGLYLWVPQSQVDDDSEVWKAGQTGTLVVSEWWANERGLV